MIAAYKDHRRRPSCWKGLRTSRAVLAGLITLAWACWPHCDRFPELFGLLQAAPVPSAPSNQPIPQAEAEAAALKSGAVAIAREVVQAYPNDPLAYALLGSAYYNTGRSEEATKYLQKCLELRPEQAEAYEILARVAYEKGNPEESIRLARESLKRSPGNPDVLNQLGRSLMDLGRTDEAVQILRQAVQTSNPLTQSYYLLGQAELQLRNYAAAKENFQRAIALLPDHTQAYFGLYTACLRLGQTEEALQFRDQFQKLEAIDRRSLRDRSTQEDSMTGLPAVRETVGRTFFGAAQLFQLHDQPGKAAELFRKAAGLDPSNPVYRSALEAHFVRRNELPQGAAVFEQLVSERPADALNYYYLGRMRARLDQTDAAAAAFRKLQQLVPQWAEGYRAEAELYLRANVQPAEARVLARRVVELSPSGPNYHLLAVACVKNNDRPGAIEAIRRATALVPDEKRYRELLQQLSPAP
jgi:tetratricopeptide (TPR) repeat protein